MIYLTLKHIIGKGSEIGSGWYNYLNPQDEIEKIAKERAKHCNSCPERKKETYLRFIKDDIKTAKGHLCKLCGCPLSMKVRSLKSNCPKKLW